MVCGPLIYNMKLMQPYLLVTEWKVLVIIFIWTVPWTIIKYAKFKFY